MKLLFLDSGKVADTISLKNAKCARDCLRILRDENLFSPEDVIFIQYLLKKTNCKELNTRCYEYAKAQKALCFYEMPSGNINYNYVLYFFFCKNGEDCTLNILKIEHGKKNLGNNQINHKPHLLSLFTVFGHFYH